MSQWIAITARTMTFLGKILIAVMAILVHHKVKEEGSIDRKVMFEIHLENIVAGLAIALWIGGYILELIYVI